MAQFRKTFSSFSVLSSYKTHRAKIHEFYHKVRGIFIFRVFKFGDLLEVWKFATKAYPQNNASWAKNIMGYGGVITTIPD